MLKKFKITGGSHTNRSYSGSSPQPETLSRHKTRYLNLQHIIFCFLYLFHKTMADPQGTIFIHFRNIACGFYVFIYAPYHGFNSLLWYIVDSSKIRILKLHCSVEDPVPVPSVMVVGLYLNPKWLNIQFLVISVGVNIIFVTFFGFSWHTWDL